LKVTTESNFFCRVPELREQFGFIGAGDEFYVGIFFDGFFKIFRDEKRLSSQRFRMSMGDAERLRREWPQA